MRRAADVCPAARLSMLFATYSGLRIRFPLPPVFYHRRLSVILSLFRTRLFGNN